MGELCAGNCKLIGEFCAVRDALGPIAAAAEVESEAAAAVGSAAATDLQDANQSFDIAMLEMILHDQDVMDESELGEELLSEAMHAFWEKIRAMSMESPISVQAKKARATSDVLHANLEVAVTSIAALPRRCNKGPKDDGSCRAPLGRRLKYKRFLARVKKQPPTFDGEWPL